MSLNVPVIALVGRTNVGKSSLFNAIVGQPRAVVEDEHGVTRDRHYALVDRFERPFMLVDTGGLVGEDSQNLRAAVRLQTELAIAEADIVVGVLDAHAGVHPFDGEVVDLLRRSHKPTLWVVNKCDAEVWENRIGEFAELGIGELRPVSAAHRRGIDTLVEELLSVMAASGASATVNQDAALRIAIVGRPNVGKSTLVNTLVGEERVVVSDLAGTTRDAVDTEITYEGQRFILVDTAGLRRQARVAPGSVEQHSNLRTVQALTSADVAVLVLDASGGFAEDQDQKIADLIHRMGRPLVIVVNKWDAIEKDHRTAKEYERAMKEVMSFVAYAPILFISAKEGTRCSKVLTTAERVFRTSHERVQTADLNRILQRAFQANPPRAYHGQPVKLFFATQVREHPPTMLLFLNHPNRFGETYQRYLKNAIRKHYPFEGTDIKIIGRKKTEKTHQREMESEAEHFSAPLPEDEGDVDNPREEL